MNFLRFLEELKNKFFNTTRNTAPCAEMNLYSVEEEYKVSSNVRTNPGASLLKRKNFSPEEFFHSDTAERHNIDNSTDSIVILSDLCTTADKIQEIRDFLGHPIRITSGYRCSELNDLVGGSKNSQHMEGQAVDFICFKFGTPEDIVRAIKKEGIEVDQCLIEKTWVHLSIKDKDNRNMFGFYLNNKFRPL